MQATQRSPWKAVAITAVLGVVVTGVFTAITGFHVGSDRFVISLDDIGVAAAALIAAASCAWTAGRSTGKVRRGWALLAASALVWAIGQATRCVYELGLGIALPSLSLADAGFLAMVPLAFAGVLSFWAAPVGPSDRLRACLDGLIVVVSLAFATWALGLQQVYHGPEDNLAEWVSEVVYPMGEVLIGTVTILVINRGARRHRAPLLLVLGGVAVSAVVHVSVAYSNVDPFRAVRVLTDSGWVFAFMLMALAARWPVRPAAVETDSSVVDMWQLVLPWMAVALAGLSALALVLQGHSFDRFLALLTALLGFLLAASQILAHKDALTMLARVRSSEQTLADVIENVPIGIARANSDLKVVDANPSLLALLRQSRELVIGDALVKYLPGVVQAQTRHRLGEVVGGAVDSIETELPMIRADGNRRWVHMTSTAVRSPGGKTDYLLVMLQDITARHEDEDRASATLAALDRLNQVKSDFLESLSHEFKTALLGVQGFSELLSDSENLDPHDIKAFARDIREGAERLDRMVKEILDADQIDAAHTCMRAELIDLNAVVRREVDEAKLGTDGLTFTTSLEPSLPAIAGDAERLSTVVRTLLHDAIRCSPDGGTITVSTGVSLGDIVVNVRDQGAAARADFDHRLFGQNDLYAHNPIRKVIGTSLDLAIARQVVEMHGGHIWMERLDGGSESHFSLPAARQTPIKHMDSVTVRPSKVA